MITNCSVIDLYNKGLFYYNMKDYEKSKQCFSEAIKNGHEHTYSLEGFENYNAKLMLARILKAENKLMDAIAQYMEAIFDANNCIKVGYEEVRKCLVEHNLTEILYELDKLVKSNINSSSLLGSFKEMQKIYMNYPREIHIETSGLCNADCVFCPHSELDRKNTIMSNKLFEKIIEDLKLIPQDRKIYISPFKVNECLLDKDIFNKIHIINQELPNAHIRFFSNYNAANENTPLKISNIKNLASLCISLNSLDEKEYRELMKLNLSRTIENLFFLFEFNKQNKFIDKITLLRVGDSTEKDNIFIKNVNDLFYEYKDQFEINVLHRGEWIDHIQSDKNILENNPCLRWFEVSITCTGDVAFCCMDGKCQYPIGNIKEQNILDIYNSKTYKDYRLNGYSRKFISPCKYCSYD